MEQNKNKPMIVNFHVRFGDVDLRKRKNNPNPSY